MLSLIWRQYLRQLSPAVQGHRKEKPVSREPRFRFHLEELESRLAPASFAVNAQLEVSRLDNLGDAATLTHAVVFFESAVADYQVLRQGLSAGTDAVVLDNGGDGLKEMAAFLAGRYDLTSIGVVAHGAPGAVALGTGTLDVDSLTTHTRELAVVGSALGREGELDVWSCDVATGQGGETLVHDLAVATGAGVAASGHMIGSAAQGGNWQLDVRAEARGAVPFSTAALRAFNELLSTWSPAASMGHARTEQTATLLGNGQVLVTGGFDGTNSLSSAELYNPVSNTWSAAGSMAVARDRNTATLLGNGQVLVTGGGNATSSYLFSAELYDPASNTWSSAGSMATARQSHTATLLDNGKVLIAGGLSINSVLSSAELYDPASNTWSSAGSMATARLYHTATLLSNGQVLVTGGRDSNLSDLSIAELYDPASNTWSSAGSMV